MAAINHNVLFVAALVFLALAWVVYATNAFTQAPSTNGTPRRPLLRSPLSVGGVARWLIPGLVIVFTIMRNIPGPLTTWLSG